MHILLTRPLEDCSEMILKFESLGHKVSHIPLIYIERVNYEKIKFSDYGGIIFTSDLDQQLMNDGYGIKRIINYRAKHNQKFSENFVKDLKLNMPDMVYVYSQNSAQSFLNFIKNQQLESLWMDTNLLCIGEKTSFILNQIKWKKIFLFNPGEEEFLLYKI